MIYKICRKLDGYILASDSLSFIPNNGKNKGKRFKTEKGAMKKIAFITLTDEDGQDGLPEFYIQGHIRNYGSLDPNDFELLKEDE